MMTAYGETDIIIDPEFRALCPPLSADERTQLEANIVRDGCREPLVVWAGRGILLDGHNRYEICTRRDIPFDVRAIDGFADREDAADWIDANQLGRRNLGPDQASLLRGRRYNRAKRSQGRPEKTRQIDGINSTAERLATEHGVSPRTVERDGAFARAVESVKSVAPDIETRIVAGIGPAKSAVVKAAALIERAPDRAAAVLNGSTRLADVIREEKETAREERREINRGKVESSPDPIAVGAKFATILLDPPWDWGDEGDCDQMGRARPTYATMPIDDIERLPVRDLSDDDCHLYLWITNRSLPKGFRLIESWGFRYVTCLTWCKPSIGMGNYFRGSTEHLLFAVRGSQPLRRRDMGTWFAAPRGPNGHSSKPIEAYGLIESCSPGPYLEMFARSSRDGWKAWGADA